MVVVFDYYKLRKSFREWRYFSLFLFFLKNSFFVFVGPILVSKEWPVSLRMFFNPVIFVPL